MRKSMYVLRSHQAVVALAIAVVAANMGSAMCGTFSGNVWSDGVIPFEFETQGDAAMTAVEQASVLNGMEDWARCGNLHFRPKEGGDVTWALIRKGQNSETDNGPALGPRKLQLANPMSLSGVRHELGHLLGLRHEHQRPDRNQFVRIEVDNLESSNDGDFVLLQSSRTYGPYDFESLMHYEQCAHSSCGRNACREDPTPACRTITVLEPNATEWQSRIGRTDEASPRDCLLISFLYPRSNWRFVDTGTSSVFQTGTFLEPYKSVQDGLASVPAGGHLIILHPTTFSGQHVYSKAMIIRAPLGGVVLR